MRRSEILAIISNYGLSPEASDALLSDLLFAGMGAPDLGFGEEGWEPEEVETPYGKSVVEEINDDIKRLSRLVDNANDSNSQILIIDS